MKNFLKRRKFSFAIIASVGAACLWPQAFASLASVDHRAEHIGTDTESAKVVAAVYPRTTPAVSAMRPAEGGFRLCLTLD